MIPATLVQENDAGPRAGGHLEKTDAPSDETSSRRASPSPLSLCPQTSPSNSHAQFLTNEPRGTLFDGETWTHASNHQWPGSTEAHCVLVRRQKCLARFRACFWLAPRSAEEEPVSWALRGAKGDHDCFHACPSFPHPSFFALGASATMKPEVRELCTYWAELYLSDFAFGLSR